MSIPREEHDAKIGALEARMDGRMTNIESAITTIREDLREIRKEMREGFREVSRSAIGMFVALLIAIVTTGITTAVALHQRMSSSMDNMLAAFATGKSTQPGIHVIPHAISPVHERQAATVLDGQPSDRNE